LRANLNSPTLHAQIADTQFSSTLITYLKGEVRRTPESRRSTSENSVWAKFAEFPFYELR
jgi:hypothetical protein